MKYMIGFIFLVVVNFANAFTFTKEFTEAELQQKIEAMMPLETQQLFMTIFITEPRLDLIEGSNQLSIQANIQAIAPGGLQGNGTTHIMGEISYRPDEGAFYLHNPIILKLKIDGIQEIYQPEIKQIAQIALSEVLLQQPVYKLDDDNLQHKLAKSKLESVLVEDEKLIVKLKMF